MTSSSSDAVVEAANANNVAGAADNAAAGNYISYLYIFNRYESRMNQL